MLSDSTFSTLRMAATLAMTVPSLRVQVSSADRVLVEVSWLDTEPPDGVVHVRPCAFRQGVACARARREEGHAVAFCGLPPDTDPRIDVIVAVGDRSLPGDIYRVRVQGGWRHIFPSLLDADRCIEAIGPDALVHGFGFQEDTATGVTLVHARTAEGDEHRIPQVSEAMLDARGRLMAEEMLAEIALAQA